MWFSLIWDMESDEATVGQGRQFEAIFTRFCSSWESFASG
jgi:hypothetical protein